MDKEDKKILSGFFLVTGFYFILWGFLSWISPSVFISTLKEYIKKEGIREDINELFDSIEQLPATK